MQPSGTLQKGCIHTDSFLPRVFELISVSRGVVEQACLRCEQANDLLSLVAELREDVERLRCIIESEREIDW